MARLACVLPGDVQLRRVHRSGAVLEAEMIAEERLHRLIEELPEGELDTARRLLEQLHGHSLDPVLSVSASS